MCKFVPICWLIFIDFFLEGVCPSHYFAFFCTTQSTLSATQGGYGEQGFQTSRGYQSQHDVNELQPSTYATYQSTVYQPFTTAVPSDDNPIHEPQISGRRNAWGGGGMGDYTEDDPGKRDPNSPVGEPFVLLLFATVAAVVIRLRKKQTA